MTEFNIIVNADPAGTSEAGFGRILVLADDVTAPVQILTEFKDLEIDSGLESYKLVQTLFQQKPQPKEVLFYGVEGGESVAMLKEVMAEEDDFFFITTTDREDISDLVEYVETLEKMLFLTQDDVDSIVRLADRGYENSFIQYHETDNYAEGMAVIMSYKVGGKTARYQTVNGIKPSMIDKTGLNRLHKANSGTYKRLKGQNQSTGSKVLSGQWLDVRLGQYWIKFLAEETVMNLAMKNDKIPYTNEGIGMLSTAIAQVMSRAVDQGIISDFRIDKRLAEDVSALEKSKREYNYLTVYATLQGAIHGGDITINLVYEEVNE